MNKFYLGKNETALKFEATTLVPVQICIPYAKRGYNHPIIGAGN
jgi:hypothetical protein